MKNRITELFASKKNGVLNVYYTAGFPGVNDTLTIAEELEKAGADIIEIGMPFSDPLADGPVIQRSSEQALENGMTMKLLFEQLANLRKNVSIPVLLMGYINPVMNYGVKNFVKKCAEVGVDGVILPDLPFVEYNELYRDLFEKNNLSNIFLVTPQTSDDRLKFIDEASSGFIYVVSTNSTTGNEAKALEEQDAYFERIKAANLNNPTLIGFNIKDNKTFTHACEFSNGAIIGSAFIKVLQESKDLKGDIEGFVKGVKG